MYDINLSYDENFENGPYFFEESIPQRNIIEKEKFLNFELNSRIGVASGPLLNSKWIKLASELGYDFLTYKTIRSSFKQSHPHPNIIYINSEEQFSINNLPQYVHESKFPNKEISITNSFGMPSKSLKYLEEDIKKANCYLKEGQIMVVSIVGTPILNNNYSPSEQYSLFVKDFTEISLFAKNCGAKIIEANFSCPNVGCSNEGKIYQNPEIVLDISSSITKALGDTPLIIKVGYYEDIELMNKIFINSSKSKVKAIAGINTVNMKVITSNSTFENPIPALGENRLNSGICGNSIRNIALDFIKKSNEIIKNKQLDLSIIGCGGISKEEHFNLFLKNGAQIVTTATGILYNPYLAYNYYLNKKI